MNTNTESVNSVGSFGSKYSIGSSPPKSPSRLSSPSRECTYDEKEKSGNITFKKITDKYSLEKYCNQLKKYLEEKDGYGAIPKHPKSDFGITTIVNGKRIRYDPPGRLCQCQSALNEKGIEFYYHPKLEKIESNPNLHRFGFGGKKRKSLKKGRKTKRKKTKKVKKTKKAKKTKKNKVKK